MSKRINVNPDHYKVAGRERQGEEVVASEERQKFVKVQHDLAARAEQRNRSLEAMKGRTTQAAREAGGGSAAQPHARKKAAKAKKAVTPRPKQALAKKKAAVRAGATSRPARKK